MEVETVQAHRILSGLLASTLALVKATTPSRLKILAIDSSLTSLLLVPMYHIQLETLTVILSLLDLAMWRPGLEPSPPRLLAPINSISYPAVFLHPLYLQSMVTSILSSPNLHLQADEKPGFTLKRASFYFDQFGHSFHKRKHVYNALQSTTTYCQ